MQLQHPLPVYFPHLALVKWDFSNFSGSVWYDDGMSLILQEYSRYFCTYVINHFLARQSWQHVGLGLFWHFHLNTIPPKERF